MAEGQAALEPVSEMKETEPALGEDECVVLAPILALAALVTIDVGSFWKRRAVRYGLTFKLFKFRTMGRATDV